MKDKSWFLYILVFVCSLCWGLSFLANTIVLDKLQPVQLLAIRWTISSAIFILLAVFKVIKINFRNKPIKFALITAMIQPCIYSTFETNGIKLTTTSESSILIDAIPVMVLVIGGLFFKKKYSKKTIFAIILAFCGVATCIVFAPNFSLGSKGLGYLLLLGAIMAGTMYSYSSSKASEHFDTMELTFVMSISGSIFFNAISFSKGYGFSGYDICFSDTKILIAVIFLGAFCSGLCFVIFNYVLSKLQPAIASSLINNSTTAIGVISGVVFAGDPFGWYTIIGLAMAFTGIFLTAEEDT